MRAYFGGERLPKGWHEDVVGQRGDDLAEGGTDKTPTARQTTLPRMGNSRNSFGMAVPIPQSRHVVAQRADHKFCLKDLCLSAKLARERW